ncbi:transcriptional regulatory protein YycF [Arthrobacter sp. Hiyo6]|nr:transcriptional regulatory protein YycF [Arthrobacter sp. Hiyo6]
MAGRGIAVIVEDDDDIREALGDVLRQSGFAVHATASGREGVEAVREHNPVLVTMDLGLPDFDGIEASRRIRIFSDAYLIIVTGKGDEADALMGFEAGADDFLTKPFRPRELRPGFRRCSAGPGNRACENPGPRPLQPNPPPLRYPVRLLQPETKTDPGPQSPAAISSTTDSPSTSTRTAEIDGTRIDLTRTQFDLLLVIMENGRLVHTKSDLVRRLRNESYDTGSFVTTAEERAVEVHIGNLRKQLGDDSRAPRWLETVRGVGYRLTP